MNSNITGVIQNLNKIFNLIVSFILIGLLIISVYLGLFLLKEWHENNSQKNHKRVTGKIVGRSKIEHFGLGIKRTVLKVKIDNSDVIVKAILSTNGKNFYRDKVSFYFSGDPLKEVYLLEESNPLIIGAFFLFAPLIFCILVIIKFKADIKQRNSI